MAYCGPRGIPLSTFLSWPEADQDAALTWQRQESARCSGCGTHPEEWAEDPHARHVELHRCRGCELLEQAHRTDEVKHAGKGVQVGLAHGSAGDCEQCLRAAAARHS